MKQLIDVTREPEAPHSMYLRYSSDAVTATVSLDGDEHYVNVDYCGSEVVGIEIVFPGDQSVDLVATFAHQNDLSLAGVFDRVYA